jgi:hypothetical protein
MVTQLLKDEDDQLMDTRLRLEKKSRTAENSPLEDKRTSFPMITGEKPTNEFARRKLFPLKRV